MSGKIGANGVFGTPTGLVILAGGAGYYEVYTRTGRGRMGLRIGYVERGRHTVRKSYKGKRYGYDRTHTCWSGGFAVRPKDGGSMSLLCYRSMSDVVDILSRDRRG